MTITHDRPWHTRHCMPMTNVQHFLLLLTTLVPACGWSHIDAPFDLPHGDGGGSGGPVPSLDGTMGDSLEDSSDSTGGESTGSTGGDICDECGPQCVVEWAGGSADAVCVCNGIETEMEFCGPCDQVDASTCECAGGAAPLEWCDIGPSCGVLDGQCLCDGSPSNPEFCLPPLCVPYEDESGDCWCDIPIVGPWMLDSLFCE